MSHNFKSTCPLQNIDITNLKTGAGSPVGLVNSHNSERSHELQNLIILFQQIIIVMVTHLIRPLANPPIITLTYTPSGADV